MGDMYNSHKGVGYHADDTDLDKVYSGDQINKSYADSQSALKQQNDFLTALQAQNGLGNQSNVFGQMQGVANGTGPNPAMAQLQQATGQNVAAQNALMAGQRGSNSNVGLMARQAGMQGANIQQQAVGQGANMQAQQSLNALGQLSGIAGQQVAQQANATTGLNQASQSQQQALLNSAAQYNNAKVGMQSNQNTANAGVAGINASHGQNGLIGGIGLSGILAHGGMVPENTQGYADGGTVQLADMSGGPSSFVGRFLNGQGSQGNVPGIQASQPLMINDTNPQKGVTGKQLVDKYGKYFTTKDSIGTGNKVDIAGGQGDMVPDTNANIQNIGTGQTQVADTGAAGGSDAAAAGGAATIGSESEVAAAGGESVAGAAVADEGLGGLAALAAHGGKIGGQASVRGDSYQNDTVPAILSPGEIVIPRSILQGKDPVKNAADFVKKTMAENAQKLARGGSVQQFEDGGEVSDSDLADMTPNTPEAARAMQGINPDAAAPSGDPVVPQSQAAQPPQEMSPQTPMGNDYVKTLEQDYANQQTHLKDYYNSLSGAGGATQKAYGQAINEMGDFRKQADAKNAYMDEQRLKLMSDVSAGHIDPNHYMNSMSTGKRILTTIGLILGGIGAGQTGGPNMALQYLNSQIDRDIEGQKAELGKKQSLLAANMQQFGQMHEAMAMTKANMLDMAKLQLEKASAGTNNLGMRQKGLLAADQLKLQSDQIIGGLKQRNTMINQAMGLPQAGGNSVEGGGQAGLSKGDPVGLVQFVTNPAQRNETIAAIGKAKHIVETQPQLKQAFFDAAKEDRPMSADGVTGAAKALWFGTLGHSPGSRQLGALEDPVIKDNLGRINEQVKSDLHALHPKFGDSQDTINNNWKAYNAIIEKQLAEAHNTARASNIDLSKFAATQPMSGINSNSSMAPPKALIDLAKKMPHDPKAQIFLKKFGNYGEGK